MQPAGIYKDEGARGATSEGDYSGRPGMGNDCRGPPGMLKLCPNPI